MFSIADLIYWISTDLLILILPLKVKMLLLMSLSPEAQNICRKRVLPFSSNLPEARSSKRRALHQTKGHQISISKALVIRWKGRWVWVLLINRTVRNRYNQLRAKDGLILSDKDPLSGLIILEILATCIFSIIQQRNSSVYAKHSELQWSIPGFGCQGDEPCKQGGPSLPETSWKDKSLHEQSWESRIA